MSLSALLAHARKEPVITRVLAHLRDSYNNGSSSASASEKETKETVVALPSPAAPLIIASLAVYSDRSPSLVVAPTSREAERLHRELSIFANWARVELFPAWETLPFERVSPSVKTMGQRLKCVSALSQEGSTRDRPLMVVTSVKALLQRMPDPRSLGEPVHLVLGEEVDRDWLLHWLIDHGYRREYQVEHHGEVAVRGGIMDIFPSTAPLPIRIELFGDEMDRLSEFDLSDQRSVGELSEAVLFGAREFLVDEQVKSAARRLEEQEPWGREVWERFSTGGCFDGMESWLPWLVDETYLLVDLLRSTGLVFMVDPDRIHDRAEEIVEEEDELVRAIMSTWGLESSRSVPRLHVDLEELRAKVVAPVVSLPPVPSAPGMQRVAVSDWEPILGNEERLAKQVKELLDQGFVLYLCASSPQVAVKLVSSMENLGVSSRFFVDDHSAPGNSTLSSASAARSSPPYPPVQQPEVGSSEQLDLTPLPQSRSRAHQQPEVGSSEQFVGVEVVVADLETGFVLPNIHVAVLTEFDITGKKRYQRPVAPKAVRRVDGFFDDLEPGSYVVHVHHGIGRYEGMVKRTVDGVVRDYLLLAYKGNDRLYVPVDQIELITPYSGGESPTLNRLGGSDWQRTRAKARAAVRKVAKELVDLYRARVSAEGHAFSPDTPWQREMEDGFGYVETEDQARAIEEVKSDMERPVPMDRLVCGDVGFGKTEIAIRAVFKAVQDGKQAAVLVPTTLLAQQHYQTFRDRFAEFPVRVEMLSRFLTPSQARRVEEGVATGEVDVVIGTHRLLSDSVHFANLGLVVVDEEHRFGVSHKEALKKMAIGVDVLTLTANPIPRTLEMGLTGIKDLSILTTPPAERQPILTFVGEMDEQAVSEAIRRELLREGQVFYVHDRVDDIEKVASLIAELVPQARIGIAHGQMEETALEKVMEDFATRELDVLVCTTIVESGIDIPAVNTLVVDRADRLGLGQLHQLRGRVGRRGQRAYAYLFYPRGVKLSEEAHERLRTIGEHTELGSGFKIAMRDLEIRGAGSLLGEDQSGHIAAVGYDLYVRMVNEAVNLAKGEIPPPVAEVTVDIPVEARLPSEYIEREDLRLEGYRRLASASTKDELDDIRAEWEDRFGPLPSPALRLLEVGLLRVEMKRAGIREVTAVPIHLRGSGQADFGVRMSPVKLSASARIRLKRLYNGALLKEDVVPPQLVLPLKKDQLTPLGLMDIISKLFPPLSTSGVAPV